MMITLALPLTHLPLFLVLALLVAAAIPARRAQPRPGLAGAAVRYGAACGSAFGRLVLGILAALGLYVFVMIAGSILQARATPAPQPVERSA